MSQPADLPPNLRDLRSRVLGAAAGEPAPNRQDAKKAVARALLFGIVTCLGVLFLFGGVSLRSRPPAFLALTLAGWSAVAVAATWAGFARGRSMLGRPFGWLVAVVLVTVPCLLGWMILSTSIWPELRLNPPADLRIHVACFIATTLLAVGPFVGFILARRRSDPVHPQATGAAIGVAAGAWASVMIDLHCPVSATAHVAIAHLGPIVLFALIGALLGRRTIAIRSE